MLQDGPTFGQLAEAAEATGFDKAVAAGVKRLPVVWDEPTRQGWVAAQLARKAAGADSLVDASLDVLDEVTAFPQPVVASCTAPFPDLSLAPCLCPFQVVKVKMVEYWQKALGAHNAAMAADPSEQAATATACHGRSSAAPAPLSLSCRQA